MSTLRLIRARVSQFWPVAQPLALLATVTGVMLVTVGMLQVFGGTSVSTSIPWTLEIGTGILGLTLALLILFVISMLCLNLLLVCVALGDFISRKRCGQQKRH